MHNTIAVIPILAGALHAAGALAQTDYPAKPIRIVIGTPAGGGSDLMARLVGQRLTQAWNATDVVEPRPGASGDSLAKGLAEAMAGR